MTTQELFERAEAMVKSDESASMAAAVRHVAMVQLSEEGRNTRENARILANEIWAVARQHGYDVE